MKKKVLFAAMALVALASCSDETFVGDVTSAPQDNSPSESNAIVFASATQGVTRAGELIGATAAEKLGGMFVVEGTKGTEQTNSPSTDVVFDNYLVGYEYNSAGKTEDNTNNWEYVGLETTGITGHMTTATWNALHSATSDAKAQTVKYWDYSTDQYDFIAWSTGNLEAVTDADDLAENVSVKVTRINKGADLAAGGFTLTALSADDLLECYYTDINTVKTTNYGKPVTLTFRNMAAKVRVAFYETVPGYSVKDVQFYTEDDATNPTAPTDLAAQPDDATLFTTGGNKLPLSGAVTVMYPHIGKNHRGAVSGDATYPNPTTDYNKASVTVGSVEGGETSTTQAFGTLTDQYRAATGNEPTGGKFLGTSLPDATYAGKAKDNYYTAVIPNNTGYPLTLRVNYTLVSTDGSAEEITVYGAKAVVPATYTAWQPNYAYTYIFKISDNSNGWTTIGATTDNQGLYPITFDAMVTSFTDVNEEQTTVTTVATPSITTYQQGHTKTNNEYSKSQTAGVSSAVKNVYVQVMDNRLATPTPKSDLNGTNKSLLYKITKSGGNYVASEAEVMDVLQNRTSDWDEENPVTSPVGRNGITLTTNTNIANDVEEIVNGVDDQPITVIGGTAAEIAIASLSAGTYAYVYCITVPSTNEKIYNVVSATEASSNYAKYYQVTVDNISAVPAPVEPATTVAAEAGYVYFVRTTDAVGGSITYTFKQTKVGDDVTGLYKAQIPVNKASGYVEGNFYFDVYNQNNGEYAVKVIKVF